MSRDVTLPKTGDPAYQARAEKYLSALNGGNEAAVVGVMLRPVDSERWDAWKTYFRAQGCKTELKGMGLCERDQWPSREPVTDLCWRMFPTNWPHEFDPKGAFDAAA